MKKTSFILILILLMHAETYPVSYKKHSRIIAKALGSYTSLTGDKRWKTIGRSARRNKILFREFGTGEKTVMIIGGMHGDEPAGVLAVIRLAQYLEKNPDSIRNRAVLIPCINPDGLRIGRRTNGRNVDLNRNFPSSTWSYESVKEYNNPGPLPASEPETFACMVMMYLYHPVLLIQMHQPFATIYPDDKTPEKLVERMSEISGFPVSYDIGYSTPGSLGSYKSEQSYKIYGITYEMGEVDREPDYKAVTGSLVEAINFP